MVRKLAAALLGVGVFIPGLANALGLGEIRLNSALSEPLDAEIELVQVRELTSTEILPGLASQSEFQAAGVERYQILGDLKFEVIIGDKGRSYIKVRSRKPIKEPFLNFLVEVNWPAGRLLREYTLLLDPPIYSEKKAQPVRQAQAAPAPAPRQAAPAQSAPQPSYTPSAEPGYSSTVSGDSHTISSNDSLWSIARNLRPSAGVSVQQTMIALQRYNPDAFIDGNINLLRRGQVLRAPSEAQAMEVSSREAIEMVAEQNRLWRERLAARKGSAAPEAQQMDLSGRTADRPAPAARPSDEGRLKLLAGTDGTGDSGQGGAEGGGGELRSRLAQAEENIDKFKLENEDLKVKMNDLEDQLKTSEKVLSLKDEQIAALQAKLAELEQQAKAEAAAAAAAVTPEPADVQAPAVTAVEEPAPVEEQPPIAAEAPVAEPEPVSADVDFNYEGSSPAAEPVTEEVTATEAPAVDEPPVEEPVAEPGLVMEEEIEPVVQQPAPEPQPVPQPAPVAPQQDLLSQIMSNPLYLGIGGGAIVLLLAAGLMIARRKKAEEEIDENIEENFQLPESSSELKDDFDIDLKEPEEDVFAAREEVPAEQTVPQTADVLGEADIYIAYGRYPQAIEMLENAAAKEPERADIRMKLCEVCAETRDANTFMKHYRVLQTLGAGALLAKADELRARVAPEADVSDTFAEAAEAEAAPEAAETFDFDIADTDADATVIAAAELDQESDTGLDFDLGDLEDTGASFAAETAQPQEEVPTLDFDLDMGGEEKPLADVETSAFAEDNSLDFDLGTEEPSAFTSPSDSAEPAPSADEALSFDAEFSLDDADIATSEPPQSGIAFDEDLSLDFDQMETTEAAPVTEDNSLDFDLDFDVEKPAEPSEFTAEPAAFDVEEDQTIAFTPAAEPTPSAEESVLDSAAAAQLADELDFDVGLGESAADEDATVVSAPALEPEAFTPPPSQPAANDFASSAEDELDFLSDADETSTKLDLARAYIDMGDRDGARDILDEVLIEGNDNQKLEAKDLLARLEG